MDPKTMTIEEQVVYLMQGTDYGDDEIKRHMTTELRQRLIAAQNEGRPLRVYCGFDPRTSDLHLGHTVVMRKMRQFQELGHEVTFLVGSYTSLIGDPSDKDKLRPQLSETQVAENARTYAEQAYKILEPARTAIRYNTEWLSQLNFAELIRLASNFTVQQFINNRDNFRQRWEKGDPIYLHETFYAIMQGYDAHTLQADVQIGGTDQMFNIVHAARKLMLALGDKPNIAIIMDILPGTDGEIKMSKSLGNHIPLLSAPEDMYGKVMSLPDRAMSKFFRLATHWKPEEIEALEAGLAAGQIHPRDAKMKLAHEITAIFCGESQAEQAERQFRRVFQQGAAPDVLPELSVVPETPLLEILLAAGFAASKAEARRLINQGGVRLDGEILQDPGQLLICSGILQAGRRRFVRLKLCE